MTYIMDGKHIFLLELSPQFPFIRQTNVNTHAATMTMTEMPVPEFIQKHYICVELLHITGGVHRV